MKVYFNPSYIVGVSLGGAHWTALDLNLDAGTTRVFSDFGFGEVVAALAARHRASPSFDLSKVRASVQLALADWRQVELITADLALATEFVGNADLVLRFPDAIHIAIARRIGAILYTGDGQQHRAALAIGLPSINPLVAQDIV